MSSRKWNSLIVPEVPKNIQDPAAVRRFLDDNQRMINNLVKLLKTPDDDDLKLRTLVFSFSGNASVSTNVAQRLHVNFPGSITNIRAYAKTAPVGDDLIFDINKGDTSIWDTDQDNRLTIEDGENDGVQTVFDSIRFAAGDVFTLDVDQVGGGTAGANITVEMEVQIDI